MALDARLAELQKTEAAAGRHPYPHPDGNILFVPDAHTDYAYAYVISNTDKIKYSTWGIGETEKAFRVLLKKDENGYKVVAPADSNASTSISNFLSDTHLTPDGLIAGPLGFFLPQTNHLNSLGAMEFYPDDVSIEGVNVEENTFEPIEFNAGDLNAKIAEIQSEAVKASVVSKYQSDKQIKSYVEEYKSGNSKFEHFDLKFNKKREDVQNMEDSKKILFDANYIFTRNFGYAEFANLDEATKTYVFARALQDKQISEEYLTAAEKERNKGINPTIDDYRETIYPRFLDASIYPGTADQSLAAATGATAPAAPLPLGPQITTPATGTQPAADAKADGELDLIGMAEKVGPMGIFIIGAIAKWAPDLVAQIPLLKDLVPESALKEKTFMDKIGVFTMILAGVSLFVEGDTMKEKFVNLKDKALDAVKATDVGSQLINATGLSPAP